MIWHTLWRHGIGHFSRFIRASLCHGVDMTSNFVSKKSASQIGKWLWEQRIPRPKIWSVLRELRMAPNTPAFSQNQLFGRLYFISTTATGLFSDRLFLWPLGVEHQVCLFSTAEAWYFLLKIGILDVLDIRKNIFIRRRCIQVV